MIKVMNCNEWKIIINIETFVIKIINGVILIVKKIATE